MCRHVTSIAIRGKFNLSAKSELTILYRGIIEEKIYHYPQDPNVVVKEILEIPPDQVDIYIKYILNVIS